MRRLLAGLVLLLWAVSAWADGVVVSGRAVVKPARTPDQRALLAFDGKQETLVIETTVQGEGRDFAWIVPLPAFPKTEESTSGLFPSLESTCAARLLNHDDHLWIGVGVVGLLIWAFLRWGEAQERPDQESHH